MLWACITFLTSCGVLPCRASMSWILMDPVESVLVVKGLSVHCFDDLGAKWLKTLQTQLLNLDDSNQRAKTPSAEIKTILLPANLTLHHRASRIWWNQNQLSWRLKHFPKQNQPVTNNGNSEAYFSGLPTIYVASSILPAFDAIMMLLTTTI